MLIFKGLRHSADPFQLELLLGPLGCLLEALAELLAASWEALGAPLVGSCRGGRRPLKAFWGRLGGPFGCSRGLLMGVGEGLGGYLGSLGVIVGLLGASWPI